MKTRRTKHMGKAITGGSSVVSPEVGDDGVEELFQRAGINRQTGVGRPTKYGPDALRIIIYAARAFGATDQQLITMLGISKPCFQKWKTKHSELREAIQEARDEFHVRGVENALLKRAMGFEFKEITTENIVFKTGFKGKIELPAQKIRVTTKMVAPDTVAAIFWLVNRTQRTGRWKNIQNVHISGGGDGDPIKLLSVNATPEEATQIYASMVKATQNQKK